ncbi:MAG: hypothetical protein Q8S84_05960 [bacterium]|nr:hypothetical protein [bacterium]
MKESGIKYRANLLSNIKLSLFFQNLFTLSSNLISKEKSFFTIFSSKS